MRRPRAKGLGPDRADVSLGVNDAGYIGLRAPSVKIAVCLLLVALPTRASSAEQLPGLSQAAPRTGLVVGRVIDAGTGSPIAGAVVDISLPAAPLVRVELFPFRMPAPPPAPFPRVMTGADGRFVFRRLPKGSFVITVVKPGYLEGAYGRRRPGGASIFQQLAADQRGGRRTTGLAWAAWCAPSKAYALAKPAARSCSYRAASC